MAKKTILAAAVEVLPAAVEVLPAAVEVLPAADAIKTTPVKYTVLHPIKIGAATRLREGDEVELDEFEANGLIALGVLSELKG